MIKHHIVIVKKREFFLFIFFCLCDIIVSPKTKERNFYDDTIEHEITRTDRGAYRLPRRRFDTAQDPGKREEL